MSILLIALLISGAVAQGPRNLEAIPAEDVEPPLVLPEGTVIPVRLITQISSEHAQEGDGVYAETIIPLAVDNKIVVPVGTYVLGRVVNATRPGRVSGTAELTINFHTLQFENGINIPIFSSLGGTGGNVERTGEAGVAGESSRGEDVTVVGTRAATGAVIGAVAGRTRGLGVGAAVGAATGITEVLLTRGDDLVLPPGTLIEIVLDVPIER